jgi:hypothetical protein
MVSHCSLSNDRSLTKHLIEISDCSSTCFHRFVHKPDWADGVDIWSSDEIRRKTKHLDFDEQIGIYLPKFEKENSQPTEMKNDLICSKVNSNNLFPERLRQLFKKQNELLKENDLNISLSDDRLSNQSDNSNQQCLFHFISN